MKNFKLEKGVTLIELLVVIGVIGILASVLLFYINPVVQFQKARDTNRKTDLEQIQGALEFYRSDLGYYPVASVLYVAGTCGGGFTSGTTTYLRQVPCDPIKPPDTIYPYTPAPSSCNNIGILCATYTLVSCLENIRDVDGDRVNSNPPCNGTTRWSKTVRNP